MKWLWAGLTVLIIAMQFRLWSGPGSFVDIWQLEQDVADRVEQIKVLESRNSHIYAEVRDLKQGHEALEERARLDLGMIAQGETFFLLLTP